VSAQVTSEVKAPPQETLTLALPVDIAALDALDDELRGLSLDDALGRIGTVHALRFVVVADRDGGWARLLLVATFDGTVEAFVADLARELPEVEGLLAFVTDPTPSPREDMKGFLEYVRRRSVPPATGVVFKSYPDLSLGTVRALPGGTSRRADPDIQRTLTLVMPVKDGVLDMLKGILHLPETPASLAGPLMTVGTVHTTQFVILEDDEGKWARLVVIATFDGTVKDYLAAFARQLNDQFNALFNFVAGAPPTPVIDHVGTFIEYVTQHNAEREENRQPCPPYRAYPALTVQDVDAERRTPSPLPAPNRPILRAAAPTAEDLDDIQGLVLRGYNKAFARHLVLEIEDAGAFKSLLGTLADEDPASGPFLTVATDWRDKPGGGALCVSLGFTNEGLEALGVDTATFPEEFRAGAAKRAEQEVRDTGPSHPDHWDPELRAARPHAIVSLYAQSEDELDVATAAILGGGVRLAGRFDAHRLSDDHREHFGFADGLSQPTLPLERPAGLPDPFPQVPIGEFVLGHPGQRPRPWAPVPEPAELGRNGSFAAFRVMGQDVRGFLDYIETESERLGIDSELLAAKMCGRWRSGEPLALRPSQSDPDIERKDLNQFDYKDDQAGMRCPRGAHIRRAFPRSQRVVDDFDGFERRIVRRAMPYGPPYEPGGADEPRGLVGMFICASLEQQFEYVMRQWLNDGLFTGGLGRTRDPLTGNNDKDESLLNLPGEPRAVEAKGFPNFVTTRWSAYLFLPSMTGLKFLAA
jgi:deferrochelatase/peroxidase EfeB